MRRLLLVLAAGLTLAVAGGSRALDLGGEWLVRAAPLEPADGFLAAKDDSGWRPMRVPSNWFTEGLNAQGAVWMRRAFNIDAPPRNSVVRLEFGGVDYAADVWLNDHYLGFHRGYFEPFGFDVAAQLVPGRNLLAVRVDSPFEPTGNGNPWSLRKTLIKGILDHHDTRPGGAWSPAGQDGNTGGIWGPVTLTIHRRVAITGARLRSEVDVARKAAHLALDLETLQSGAAYTAELQLTLAPRNHRGAAIRRRIPCTILPGTSRVHAEFDLDDVHLWWPAGHGDPDLYVATIALADANGVDSQVTQNVGFRTVAFDGHEWHINGRRLFLRGTNYIGTLWLATLREDDYRRDVALMREANINAIRVHAHVASPAFYDVADVAGMLIWQDMPLQWGYDDSGAFALEAARQARAMQTLLNAHPSIIAWSGQNEPPFDADWMRYRYADYDPDQNRTLTTEVATALSEDTTRYTHPFSATREHYWQGWYFADWHDHAKPAKDAIISEFGAQALPSRTTLAGIVGEANLWPQTDAQWANWEYHNFQKKETFENARIDRGASIETFIANSQRYQADVVKLAAESYRRQRYAPVAAVFQFMFVEHWPSMNWGIVDYLRHPKAGYDALAVAYQPVLPSIAWEKEAVATGDGARFGLWAINDSWQRHPNARLVYRLLRDREEAGAGKFTFDLDDDSGRKVADVAFDALAAGGYRLEVEIDDAQGVRLGSNAFGFSVRDPQ
jgi:beta-mannosidase